MRVLLWNLYHGRSVPPSGRDLLPEFTAALAGWDWDVALLQEVPPWWPARLGAACGASARMARTSRNLGLPLRRWIAERWPDLIKSNGGGANAILVRGEGIAEHRRATLRLRPERRVVHAVRLAASGIWVANLHAQVRTEAGALADLARAARAASGWAGPAAPVVLGGDCNVPSPRAEGFSHAAGRGVDHVLVRGGPAAVGPARVLPRQGGLSDHLPLLVELARV
jgi:endonuclease/exonuclease/phosphatase family metal-dependent hydrolase